MMSKVFFIIIGSFMVLIGMLTFFRANDVKNILQFIKRNDLFYLPGVFEIIFSLSILYFRYDTKIPFIITMLGLLIFIDGVFYLVGSKVLEETYAMVMEMEKVHFRIYSLVFFIIAAILLVGII
jgi:hypothetical protein